MIISLFVFSAYKMGCGVETLVILLIGIAVYFYRKYNGKPKLQLPKVDLERWWGSGAPKDTDKSIRTFKIEFKEEMINDLQNRLSKTALTPPLEDVGFEYGFNNNYLKEVIDFWSKDYNFKDRENFLNQYPHFKTNIQGLDIHFIHVKPKVAENVDVVPLLLLHGWPGSVREFYEAIPLLTSPRKDKDFVFEVIVPSLPGYGFSQAVSKKEFGVDNMAVVLRNLMHRLGFKKYYIQGGDWGAFLVHNIGIFFPDEVLGLHSNMVSIRTPLSTLKWIIGSWWPTLVVPDQYSDRMYPVWEKLAYIMEEFGYMHLQATKPDTVGVALRDSPAGLAAYILEKFSTWTNPSFRRLKDGGITRKYTLVNLLDNVMIYWSTGSITTSMRLYAETINKRYEGLKLNTFPVTVPSAVAYFKHDIMYTPEMTMREKFKNVVQVSHFDDGGHFAAFEAPDVLTEDVWSAVTKIRRSAGTSESKKND